jgi:hypothetical protein
VDQRELGNEDRDGRRVRGVGVDDGLCAGRAVHREVHRQFTGREQRAEHLPAVEVHADDVVVRQPVVGHARGRDQDGVADADRDVARGADDEPVGDRPAGRRDELVPGPAEDFPCVPRGRPVPLVVLVRHPWVLPSVPRVPVPLSHAAILPAVAVDASRAGAL